MPGSLPKTHTKRQRDDLPGLFHCAYSAARPLSIQSATRSAVCASVHGRDLCTVGADLFLKVAGLYLLVSFVQQLEPSGSTSLFGIFKDRYSLRAAGKNSAAELGLCSPACAVVVTE